MPSASDITGTVFKDGSATLLARVVGAGGAAIQQADLSAIAYTVYLLDEADPDSGTAVSGHTAVSAVVADTIFDTLQKDELWKDQAGNYIDALGYNFNYTLNTGTAPAFATAGRVYRIVFTLTPVSGQKILLRFKVRAI